MNTDEGKGSAAKGERLKRLISSVGSVLKAAADGISRAAEKSREGERSRPHLAMHLVDMTENRPILDRMKTLTISKAKARLGPLTDQVARTGKPVLLRRGGRIFEIRERPMIEPIEYAPVGDLPVGENERELQKLNVFEFGPEILH